MKRLCYLPNLVLWLNLGGCVFAQSPACAPGELRVFVVDSQEGPVFDAQVRISSGAGAPVEHVTPANGIADFQKVPCGAWSVITAKEGFEAAVKTVQINSAGNVEIDSWKLDP